jgi:octopine/nopaline transport system ATP-binding protein
MDEKIGNPGAESGFLLLNDRLTRRCPAQHRGRRPHRVPGPETSRRAMKPKLVEVEGLRKSFGPIEVLKGVSITARQGDVLALIGGSGSGKSTLLRCLNLLEIPNAGLLVVNGESVRIRTDRLGRPSLADKAQMARIRSGIGMVFQSFNLWPHRTVLENVTEAPIHVLKENRAEARDHALALLERVGLAEKRDAYPGFLSGGQQQRVAIARALAIRPRLLLFDEPTSALDPELVGEVLKVIRALAEEGRTMVLVTHEMRFARDVASHVAFLREGVIEEEGAPESLFRDPRTAACRQFIGTHLSR